MNKQLSVYMPLIILCMLMLKELMKALKEMILFFVLKLQEIVMLTCIFYKCLNYRLLKCYRANFQFSVSGAQFSKN
jgi:hypothetical protein